MTVNYRDQPDRGHIFKAHPGEDAYVSWSGMVELPHFVGTRDEMIAHGYAEERLDRADKKGTSVFNIDDWWEDEDGQIAEQLGFIRREKIIEYSRLYLAGDKDAAYALLEPFDHDDEAEAETSTTQEDRKRQCHPTAELTGRRRLSSPPDGSPAP